MFCSLVIGQWNTTHIKKRNDKKKLCHFSARRPQISEVVFTHGSVARLPHTPAEVRWYFLAMLYDHKPWPDHPRDPAGYCQIGHHTAVIVGSLTACIQSRNWFLFGRSEESYGDLAAPFHPRPENSCRCGISFLIKEWMFGEIFEAEGQLCFLAVLVFVFTYLFCFSAHGLVWSRVQGQASVLPRPRQAPLPTPSFKARWKCRCFIALNSQDVT